MRPRGKPADLPVKLRGEIDLAVRIDAESQVGAGRAAAKNLEKRLLYASRVEGELLDGGLSTKGEVVDISEIDLASVEVAEDVLPLQVRHGGPAVHKAADDGDALRSVVGCDRVGVSKGGIVGGPSVDLGLIPRGVIDDEHPLPLRPAVVRSGDTKIDFFRVLLADV